MSVSDHLKAAAAELMKAADMVRIEMDDLRKQEAQTKRESENVIEQMTLQMHHHEQEYNRSDDAGQRDMHRNMVGRLQREIADKQSELQNTTKAIQDSINQKSHLQSQLESQARSIH